jgi:cobalt-zinc-cadmium resistance protein CzcA
MKNRFKNLSIGAWAAGFFLVAQCAFAQTPISLQTAVNMALEQNNSIKNERLAAEYRKKLVRSGVAIPQTSIYGEYGQFNSAANDLSVGISQSLNFPTVYSSQKKLLNEEWKSSVLHVGVKENELQKQVAQTYFQLAYLLDKRQLLIEIDSLFSNYRTIATLRFEKGEQNILEKATAENQQSQIHLQLIQLQGDIEIVQLQFQLLLNTETVYVPETNTAVFKRLPSDIDTSLLCTDPNLRYLKQQEIVAQATTQAERQKLLPDIHLGYNRMGMRENGTDPMYDGNLRLQYINFGLGIPLFFGGQKAKITASKMQETIAKNGYETQKQLVENAYLTAVETYKNHQQMVDYFETVSLQNAQTITETANQQFLSGNIDYLERVLLVNQAIEIRSNYIETVRNRNMAIVEINSFVNQ